MRAVKRNLSQDQKRISYEQHEIEYAANQLKSKQVTLAKAKAAVLGAKKTLGRKTKRETVMDLAAKIAKSSRKTASTRA